MFLCVPCLYVGSINVEVSAFAHLRVHLCIICVAMFLCLFNIWLLMSIYLCISVSGYVLCTFLCVCHVSVSGLLYVCLCHGFYVR